jgi:hypothetical protein
MALLAEGLCWNPSRGAWAYLCRVTSLVAAAIISARIPFGSSDYPPSLILDVRERNGSSNMTAALLETGERRSCQGKAKLGYRRPSLETAGYWHAGQYMLRDEADFRCNRQYCCVLVVVVFGARVLLRFRVR